MSDEKTIDNVAAMDDVAVGVGAGDYEPPSEFARPPDAGTYTFMRVDDQEGDLKHGRTVTKTGQPMAWFNFKAQIVGGALDGRICFLGCNTLVSTFRKGSTADDFLRSARSSARPTTMKTYEEAVTRTFGPFNARGDWEWRCKDCEETFATGQKKPKVKKSFKRDNPEVEVKLVDGSVSQKCPLCSADVGANWACLDFVVPKSSNGVVTGPAPTTLASNLPPAIG